MEVACRDDQILVRTYRRVIGRGIDLHVNDRLDIRDGILDSPMHLRNATEGVRILHVHLGLGYQFTAPEQGIQMTRRSQLAKMRTYHVDSKVKGIDTAVVGLQ